MEYVTIKGIKIEKTATLAPMASVADRAYRTIMKEFGAAFVTGEMASAKGLVYGDKKTAELLTVTNFERPAAIQLFGNEPEFMAKAAQIAAQFHPDFIDINCGCPVPKVVGGGAGSALMKNPRLIGEIVSAVQSAVEIPVTVKIRAGWDEDSINAVEAAKYAEDAGACAIAVHARTRNQMYHGRADRSIIAAVKTGVSVPVIGNGDVDSLEECLKMYEETQCDLVMIGRGSYGNPWLFQQIRQYFIDKTILPPPSFAERICVMRRHIGLLVENKGEFIGMKEARSQAARYLKGCGNAAKYRYLCGTLSTLQQFNELCEQISEENNINEID